MTLVVALALVQLALPVALIVWTARGEETSWAGWIAKSAATTLYALAALVCGLWSFVPWPTPYLLPALAIASLGVACRRRPRTAVPDSPGGWAVAAIAVIVLTAAAWAIAAGMRGHQRPDGAVDLQFPLGPGTFAVVNGGHDALLNGHFAALAEPRLRNYRGQSYGVDLVQLNAAGMRARGIISPRLEDYAIYGAPVHAPCSGTVVQSVDGKPDMPPGIRDRANIPGNHVLLECAGVHVLLAHLQQGTVAVGIGAIAAGTHVGRVGNSGNTDEPHLHVHAQLPAGPDAPFAGAPLPITFGSNPLVRNDRITVPAGD